MCCFQLYPICRVGINLCNAAPTVPFLCSQATRFCEATQYAPIITLTGNINPYDVRKPCAGELCYDFSLLDEYLALPSVHEQLGVGDRK